MELHGETTNSLATYFQHEIKESGTLGETGDFANLPSQFFPILAQLWLQYDRAEKENTARTKQCGRIVDLNTDDDVAEASADSKDETFWKLFRSDKFSACYELYERLLSYLIGLICEPRKQIYYPSKTYENIKANLIRLEDNGDFTKLHNYAGEMVKKYQEKGDFDIVTIVTVEQGQCFLYKNNLARAKRFAQQAHELAEHTRCPPLFHAQAYLLRSSVARYKGKLGNAKKYLDLAKQCFATSYCIEDLAYFHELYGSYLDKFLGVLGKPNEDIKKLAITSFHKMSEIAMRDSRSCVSDKNRFYSLIKMARILLDSNSSAGRRQRTVTTESINLASEYIGIIKRDLWESIPRGSKIQLQLVESDLYYRQDRFDESQKILEKSLEEAKLFEFKSEEPKICQRIQEIEEIIEATIVVEPKAVETEENNNSNDAANDYDSGTSQGESDIFTSKYF